MPLYLHRDGQKISKSPWATQCVSRKKRNNRERSTWPSGDKHVGRPSVGFGLRPEAADARDINLPPNYAARTDRLTWRRPRTTLAIAAALYLGWFREHSDALGARKRVDSRACIDLNARTLWSLVLWNHRFFIAPTCLEIRQFQ